MIWRIAHKIPKKIRKALSNFSDIEAQLLYNKGITSNSQAKRYFDPKLDNIAAAELLPNAKKAAAFVLDAIKEKKKIFIYGDYDVDGICSTSILFDFLFRKLNANVLPYIPDRFEEGYGLNKIGLDHILAEGGQLVITVDCGIRDAKLIKEYTKKGLEFIVTDHHSLPAELAGKKIGEKKDSDKKEVAKKTEGFIEPDFALAVVHPQLGDYEFPNICATAVVWKLVQVLCTLKKIKTPDEYIDLVALATVCDVMPLMSENRDIVSEGIKFIKANKSNKGLKEIIKLAQLDKDIFDSYHFGFVIGPRLNAAGRMDHALNGVRLFTSNNAEQISGLALKLHSLNVKRQELTESMLKESMEDAQRQIKEGQKLLFIAKENWSEGIVGLIAGRLNEKFFLPVLAASIKEGNVKGSARSVPGFNITKAISQNEKILKKFGGHNQAAGFSLSEDNLQEFVENMHSIAKAELADDLVLRQIDVDMDLDAQEINIELLETVLAKFRPFGFGNLEPVFAIRNVSIIQAPILMGAKGQHLKFSVQTSKDIQADSSIIEVVVFNRADKFFDIINLQKRYDLAGTLGINEWRGNKTIQLRLKELIQLD
jgi:single-stranded-DNA-specific exonuclease